MLFLNSPLQHKDSGPLQPTESALHQSEVSFHITASSKVCLSRIPGAVEWHIAGHRLRGHTETVPVCLALTLALRCQTELPCSLIVQSRSEPLLSQTTTVPEPNWAVARSICPKSPSSERLWALPLRPPLSEQAWLRQEKPILPALLNTALQRHISH